MQTDRLRRFQGCLVGLAVGDALGMPVEGLPRHEIRQRYGVLREMVDGWLPAGSTTDDTAQALALAESLAEVGHFDADDFVVRLLTWFRGNPPDVGVHTRRVLELIDQGVHWREAVERVEMQHAPFTAGNGSLMRCAPIALRYYRDVDAVIGYSHEQSRVTHPNHLARAACAFFNVVLARVLRGEDREAAVGYAMEVLSHSPAELLERVFRFGERRVREVMVPRTEVVWLERGTTVRQFYSIFVDRPHSRFPVYEGSVDNVVGIVNIKDVLKGLAQEELSPDSPIDWCMRPALFVPESKRVGDLFWEMQRSGQQMAVVVDEFGGTAGVVTLEMLLEELVGVVSDELRPAQQEFVTVDERTYRLDGGMSIDDANQELGLDLPEGDYETVAGFVLDYLGHVPRQGEQFVYNGLRITVTRMSGRKIEEVTVTKLGTTPGQEGSP